jgi:hypothetical protein
VKGDREAAQNSSLIDSPYTQSTYSCSRCWAKPVEGTTKKSAGREQGHWGPEYLNMAMKQHVRPLQLLFLGLNPK